MFFYFFVFFITKHPVWIFMSMSISPEIAFQLGLPVATLHSLQVISFLIDKTRIWGTVSHPLSQMRENRRGHDYFDALTPKKKKAAKEIHNLWEALFARDNHNLRGGRDMDFIQFFQYLLSKILAIYVKAGNAALRVHFLSGGSFKCLRMLQLS